MVLVLRFVIGAIHILGISVSIRVYVLLVNNACDNQRSFHANPLLSLVLLRIFFKRSSRIDAITACWMLASVLSQLLKVMDNHSGFGFPFCYTVRQFRSLSLSRHETLSTSIVCTVFSRYLSKPNLAQSHVGYALPSTTGPISQCSF